MDPFVVVLGVMAALTMGGYVVTKLGLVDIAAGVRARTWREAARLASLTDIEESGTSLSGWKGPLHVRLSRYEDREAHGTRIAISGPGVPPDLTVRPESLGTTLDRSLRGAREVEIGHDTFDAAAWIQGTPAVVRAVLDAETRRALRALFDGRLERPGQSPFWATGRVENGVLLIDVPEVRVPTPLFQAFLDSAQEKPSAGEVYLGGPEKLPEAVQAAVTLAERLAPPKDAARRLAENLTREPVAGVRLGILATLAGDFPRHPATREALVAASRDPDAEVRVRAAAALGPDGRDVLLAVAGGEGAPDSTTARAVAALGERLTAEEAQRLLHNALRTRREMTAAACLAVLARRRGPGVTEALVRVLGVEKGRLAVAAADALGERGEVSAEVPLLEALADWPPAKREAAARALGRVGTATAVAALRKAEARGGGLRRAARQAVAEIQARLAGAAGAAPGQLSLAVGEAGQVSLADGEAGRLSFVEADHARDVGGRRSSPRRGAGRAGE